MAGPGFTPVNPGRRTARKPSSAPRRPGRSTRAVPPVARSRGAADAGVGLGSRPGSAGVARSAPPVRRKPTHGPLRDGRRRSATAALLRRLRRPGSDQSARVHAVARPRRRRRHAAGRQPEIQAPVRHRRCGPERAGHRRALDHPGWRAHLDPPRRRPGPRLADRGRPWRRGNIRTCAWWHGRRRDWATSPPRQEIRLNRGSRSTAHRRPSSSSRPRSAPASTPARWRSPGGRAIFTCRPSRSRFSGGPTSPVHAGRRSPMAQENAGQFVWTVPATVPQRFHLKVEAVDSVGHRGSAETTDIGPDHGRSQPAAQPDHRP